MENENTLKSFDEEMEENFRSYRNFVISNDFVPTIMPLSKQEYCHAVNYAFNHEHCDIEHSNGIHEMKFRWNAFVVTLVCLDGNGFIEFSL